MKDQVTRLTSLGINATSLSEINSEAIQKEVDNGKYSIVYRSHIIILRRTVS